MSFKSTACDLTLDSRFAHLGDTPQRIWAVAAIHGETEKLIALHDQMFNHIRPGDRIVYLGNYGGYGPSPCETLDEILTFRRGILAQPGMMPSDFVYLRGGQEEMWEKLQQLQFAPNPRDVLIWMLDNGLTPTLEDYGLRPQDGLNAAAEGVISITRWTAAVRNSIRRYPGHDIFQCQLRRAAFTNPKGETPLLFVHAGINTARPLQEQGDSLWWGGQNFNMIATGYLPFKKVVRGYDSRHYGLHIGEHTASIDAGCGFNGALVAAAFDPDGEIIGVLEA